MGARGREIHVSIRVDQRNPEGGRNQDIPTSVNISHNDPTIIPPFPSYLGGVAQFPYVELNPPDVVTARPCIIVEQLHFQVVLLGAGKGEGGRGVGWGGRRGE